MAYCIDEYAEFTEETWRTLEDRDRELSIIALGLTGESGEVSEIVKKYLHYGIAIDRAKIEKELGDVAFYWARLCRILDIFPSDVLETNKAKLRDRLQRGVIRGEGSNR